MYITNKKRLFKEKSFDIVLLLLAVVILFPYLWMILASLKPVEEVFSHELRLFPKKWLFGNYLHVFTPSFRQSIANSFIVLFFGVISDVLIAFMAGFAFAQLNFYGKNVLFFIILGTLMIPPQVLMLPSYLLIGKLKWLNTYQGLIIPRLTPAFGMFLIRQFILTVPKEIEEASQLDGATMIQRMVRLYWPICFPAITTVGVFSLIGYWNDYYWPLMIISDKNYRTLSLAIAQLKSLEGLGNWSHQMAAAVIATTPMMILYIFARKTLVENITAGAVKG